MACKCIKQKDDLKIGLARRWVIYIIGVLEALLMAGCIFGWAQLVYVLKNEEIFYNLCEGNQTYQNSTNLTEFEEKKLALLRGCDEQDNAFALIYTLMGVFYGIPAFLTGMLLHYWGLAITRISASTLLTSGFIILGLTDKDNSGLLYVAMIMMSVGANQIRMASLQLCNLFPNYRSTALSIIGGSFAASSALFMVFQFGQQAGVPLRTTSFSLALVAFLSIPATFIMPLHHIPHNHPAEETQKESQRIKIPLARSLLSISALTQVYWLSANLIVMSAHIFVFNPWISRISQTNEEAGHYSLLFSLSQILCPLVSPLPGLLSDYLSKGSPDDTRSQRYRRRIQSPVISLALVTLTGILLRICLFFDHPVAIYCSLVACMVLRPSIVATSASFLRISISKIAFGLLFMLIDGSVINSVLISSIVERVYARPYLQFPAEHFNRMVGIQGTIMSSLASIQYVLFLWIQQDFIPAMIFFLCVLIITFAHPLHLLSKSYMNKLTKQYLEDFPQNDNLLPNGVVSK